jgi:hypothetical protein
VRVERLARGCTSCLVPDPLTRHWSRAGWLESERVLLLAIRRCIVHRLRTQADFNRSRMRDEHGRSSRVRFFGAVHACPAPRHHTRVATRRSQVGQLSVDVRIPCPARVSPARSPASSIEQPRGFPQPHATSCIPNNHARMCQLPNFIRATRDVRIVHHANPSPDCAARRLSDAKPQTLRLLRVCWWSCRVVGLVAPRG